MRLGQNEHPVLPVRHRKLELLGQKVHLVLPVRHRKLELQGLQEHPVPLERLGQKERPVLPVRHRKLEHPVPLERLEQKVHSELPVRHRKLEHPEQQGPRERHQQPVRPVLQEQQLQRPLRLHRHLRHQQRQPSWRLRPSSPQPCASFPLQRDA